MSGIKPVRQILKIALIFLGLGAIALVLYLLFVKDPQVTINTYLDKDRVVAVVTPSSELAPEESRAVQDALLRYGSYGEGGQIRHLTLGTEECLSLTKCLESVVEDPRVKVLVLLRALSGSAQALINVRKKHPALIILASDPEDDPGPMAKDANLIVSSDFVSRAYTIPVTAHGLGVKTIVRLCRNQNLLTVPERQFLSIMDKVASDNGMLVNEMIIPDHVDSISESQDYVKNFFPEWLYRFSSFTLFFTCEDAMKTPLIGAVAKQGGFFLEGMNPSPYQGYPEVFGVKNPMGLSPDKLLEKLSELSVTGDFPSRIGSAPTSSPYELGRSLIELSIRLMDGSGKLGDFSLILSRGGASVPWHQKTYVDPITHREIPEYLLFYQDAFVLGMGVALPGLSVPLKYSYVYPKRPLNSFHIGLLVSDTGQAKDNLRGAKEMIETYGEVSDGGLIWLETINNDFPENIKKTEALVEGFIEDPLLKVIVINSGVPGTAQGLATVLTERPDIYTIICQTHEDLRLASQVSDLIIMTDFVARGYLVPYSAKTLGAESFVHISFERHMDTIKMMRRRDLMKISARDLGLNFYEIEGVDPTGEEGVEGARDHIMENYPKWIEEYSDKTAFYSTNDAHAEALIRSAVKYGGIFVEADIPSPLTGYPDALDVPVSENDSKDYWPKYVKLLEDKAVELGAGGRLGTWVYPSGSTMGMAAVEFGRRIVQAESEPGNTASILHTLDSFTPGSRWSGTFFVDAFSGKPLRDIILLYQDTYILGRGYLHTRDVSIPKEYFLTGFSFSSEAKDIRQGDDDDKEKNPEEKKSGAGSK